MNNVRHDPFFKQSMNLKKRVLSESSFRNRFEEDAEKLLPIIKQLVIEYLTSSQATITPLPIGHVALDFDCHTA